MPATAAWVVGSLMVALVLAVTGCGDARSPSVWSGSVDTLAGGTVEVRSPARGLWDQDSGWSLEEDLRIGTVEGDSPELFGRVVDLEVDEEGRLYVLESDAGEVRVFGPDGTHLRSFGRRGQGPGELQRPVALAWGPGDRLWVVDTGNHRYSVFDTTGVLVDEKRRFADGQVAPWPGTVVKDGRVVDVDLRGGRIYTIHGPDGTVQDTVSVPGFESPSFVHTTESSRLSVGVPFAPRLQVRFDPRGFLWTGVSEDYRIVQRSLDGGDSLRVIRRVYDPVPVTDLEREAALERMAWFRDQGGRVDASRIPERHPAFRGFLVDRRGYLWVEPVTPRPEPVTPEDLVRPLPAVWDVFDDGGRYLGRLEAGMVLGSVRVTDTHVHGVTVDELGVPYVVRLRIEGRESG